MSSKQTQQGAVAIEFSAIFILFMVMVFGIISYGIPTAVRMAFQHYSAEAARAAMISSSNPADEVDRVISESWLDEGWLSPCDLTEWQSTSSRYAFTRAIPDATSDQLQVCLNSTHSFIVSFNFFGFMFPPLPRDDDGNVVIRGYTITTL